MENIKEELNKRLVLSKVDSDSIEKAYNIKPFSDNENLSNDTKIGYIIIKNFFPKKM